MRLGRQAYWGFNLYPDAGEGGGCFVPVLRREPAGGDCHLAAASEARTARADIAAAAVSAWACIQLRAAMRAAQKTSQQITTRGAIRSTIGIAELRPQLLRPRRRDDRRPLRLRNNLATVFALAADPTRHQQPPKRLRTPSLPVTDTTPARFKSVQIPRKESPANTRAAHSRTTAASAGRIVRRSSSKPNGRVPPPDTRPAAASSSCLRRMRRLLSSLSLRATAPVIRASSWPSWVERSRSPLTVASFVCVRWQRSMKSSARADADATGPRGTRQRPRQPRRQRPPASAGTQDDACRCRR